MSWLYWLFILILLAAAGGAACWPIARTSMGDTSLNLGGWLFRPRPEPRLGVIEQASVDSRRRLVLIRRDDVEHLIMTGGPVDVVIETGIQAPHGPSRPRRAPAEPSPPSSPVSRAVSAKPSTNERTRISGVSAVLSPRRAPARDRVRSRPPRRRRRRSPQPHRRPPQAKPRAGASRAGAACPRSPRASTRLTSAIETAEKTIQHLAELEEELGRLRVDVETILSESAETAETLRPQLAAVRSQIEKLGPAARQGRARPRRRRSPPSAPG